jgi:hypothetical protein
MMAPRFPRTRKIAHPTAMLTVDVVFTVIWLSAFSTQAAYNTANQCGTACNISKAVVGMAFFVLYAPKPCLVLPLFTKTADELTKPSPTAVYSSA